MLVIREMCRFLHNSLPVFPCHFAYLLVDKVRDESCAGDAARLVVAPVSALEVEDESLQEELADVGELGVDDGGQGGVHVREGGRGHLKVNAI